MGVCMRCVYGKVGVSWVRAGVPLGALVCRAVGHLADTGAPRCARAGVDDGDLVTSGGVSSGIHLALWLVERECGAELADRVSEHMEYRRTRPTDQPVAVTSPGETLSRSR